VAYVFGKLRRQLVADQDLNAGGRTDPRQFFGCENT
jgi:hypothetical protein